MVFNVISEKKTEKTLNLWRFSESNSLVAAAAHGISGNLNRNYTNCKPVFLYEKNNLYR